jgi:hypothetical protein
MPRGEVRLAGQSSSNIVAVRAVVPNAKCSFSAAGSKMADCGG